MNLELFDKLFEERPSQNKPEWRMFLEICEMHLKKRGIKNPVVVELGLWKNRQKKFYEQLLGMEHIGIDYTGKRCTPDILGNTHDPATVSALKKKLKKRRINILFIDASHRYKNVKKDFELYSPLCSDIVAIHDADLGRHQDKRTREVYKFWDELKAKAYAGEGEYKDFMFLSIHQHRSSGDKSQMGVGVIIKR